MLTRWRYKYVNFVKNNSANASELESALKWLSYIISGRSKDSSSLFAELLYSSSNVLSLVNDTILRGSLPKIDGKLVQGLTRLKLNLTVLEYVEVLFELTSLRVCGSYGKWLIITIIQLLRAAMRIYLLLVHGCKLLRSPPIPPLSTSERKKLVKELHTNVQCCSKGKTQEAANITFTLKHSGRVIRTLSATPAIGPRMWKLPDNHTLPLANSDNPDIFGSRAQIAEILYILRPLVHLLSMRIFGIKSWKPWLIAMGIDVGSLQLIGHDGGSNAELQYRKWYLLFYLLRSPFFEKYSKERIVRVLKVVAETIPGAGFICNPLVEYLPTWQSTYFYTWAS